MGRRRCRVGHSWALLALLEKQGATLEHALWTALRALAERADVARRMRDDAASREHPHALRLFDEQLKEFEYNADVIRDVLRRPEPLANADVELSPVVPLAGGLEET